AAQFNLANPDAPGVSYYSIAGRSNLAPDDGVCTTNEPPFIARWDADLDAIGGALAVSGAILTGNPFSPTYNDGLVPDQSAQWGTFLGCIPADHLEEIGQPAGAAPGFGNPFDEVQFYRDLANWLVAKGF
ncbi:MAG: esterase/lipase family protein, partial [Deltaproteobacteria bacterium]